MVRSEKLHGVREEGTAEREPWEQMPGEPNRWFGRFQMYLGLGPTRTLRQAQCSLPLREDGTRPVWTGKWSWMAAVWHWRERAQAWDEDQRHLLALSERNVRRGLHHQRVAVIEEAVEKVRTLLNAANLEEADQETARALLPQMRVFLRDMLAAERQEFEHDFTDDDRSAVALITADDLRAAQREMEQSMQQAGAANLAPVRRGEHMDEATARLRLQHFSAGKEGRFLVCTGSDPELLLDLAALRAVRAATGLTFARVLKATRYKLGGALRRQRGVGYPVEYLHMAVHASAEGVELTDGPVDGNWLSEHLAGVRVLLLANWEGDRIGGWLGVVPYVITLSEEMPNADAAALARYFWQGMGSGLEPYAALDAALGKCPPAAGEYVVRHW